MCLYFTEILCEILTTMETIKQQQKMILLQMQTNYPHALEVPEVSEFPLTGLCEVCDLTVILLCTYIKCIHMSAEGFYSVT